MANDPTQQDPTTNQEPHGTDGGEGGEGTDYEALYTKAVAASRKWESRAKSNAEKAKKYDELAAGNKSVEDRIAALEAQNKQLEHERERAKVVKAVAKATGVPESIVSALSGADEESLTTQAKAIADNYKTPGGAPKAPEAGKFPKDGGNVGKTTAELFADAIKDF